LSFTLLSMLLWTWKVGCPILCYLCYSGFGTLVVLYFAIDIIEDLVVCCPILCSLCYRGLGGLVTYTLLSMLLMTWKVSCPILCYLCY
jgi:hypothetical protein